MFGKEHYAETAEDKSCRQACLKAGFLLGLLMAMTVATFGQIGEAELTGIIKDQSGATLAGAKLTLTATETGQTFSLTTESDGSYTFTDLKPGTYSLNVEATGFKRFVQTGIVLATGERNRVDPQMVTGGVDETVIVTSDAPLLRTESGSLGQVINSKKIEDLPLNGRVFITLAGFVPGVALPPGTSSRV